MERIELKKVENELERVKNEIAELRDEFWDYSEWDEEKEKLGAQIEARQDWETKLEASKETIVVMNNGGIAANIDTKVNNQQKKPIYEVDLTRSERQSGRIGFVS